MNEQRDDGARQRGASDYSGHRKPLPLWVRAIPQQLRDIMEAIRELIRIERRAEHLELEGEELIHEILKEMRSRLRRQLAFSLKVNGGNVITIKGARMTTTMLATQKVPATISPVIADGTTPSLATLSNIQFSTSDPTIATVAQDPLNPAGCIIQGVAVGSAVILATATATEPDGTTTEVIQGSLTVILTAPTPPPAPPAAALVFSVGTPTDQ